MKTKGFQKHGCLCTRSVTSLWYTDKYNCKVLSGTICNETACHKVNQQMGERELILGYSHMWSGAIPKIKALGGHRIAEKISENSWVLKICLIKYITIIRKVAGPKNANHIQLARIKNMKCRGQLHLHNCLLSHGIWL